MSICPVNWIMRGNTDEMQYVATTSPLSSSSLAPYYYVMGHMDQKTYGLTLKLQVNVTPDISIQFYGAPFTSIAKYDDFKLAADTKSHTFENRFQRIDPDQLTYADGVYTIGRELGRCLLGTLILGLTSFVPTW